jgi:hypothetical protein
LESVVEALLQKKQLISSTRERMLDAECAFGNPAV